MLKIQVEKITGLADENHTSSVFLKRINVSGDLIGTLVGCALAGNGSFSDLQTIIHGLFEIFAGKLEGSERNIGDCLLEALGAGKNYILEQGLEVSFTICFFYQNACFVVRFGNKVKVWTYKDGKSGELVFDFGSGPYVAGQIFTLGTEKFFDTFDTLALLTGEELDLEDVIDGLATDISSSEKQSELGVAFVKIGDEVEPKTDGTGDLGIDKDQEQQVDVIPVEETIATSEVQARDEVDSQVFDAGEEIIAKKHKFGPGKAAGRLFGAVFAEINKLRRGDIRAMFRLRRNLVMVAVLLLVVLAGSVFFAINNQNQAKKTLEFKKQVESAKLNLAEGESIVSLNYERARGKLVDANSSIGRALALFPKDSEAIQLKGEIESKLKETENVSGLPFKEVTDVGEGLVSLSLGKTGLTAFSENKIIKILKEGKIGDKVDSLSGTQGGFVWDNSAFVIASGKIVKIDLGAGKKENVANIDFGRDLAVFLGNVYVLGNDQIIKFVPIEKGYGDGQNYLEKKETFGNSSRFAIDGMIWVTEKNQILKYNRGKREDFSILGMVVSDVDFGEIYTNSDIDNIYVIDKLNGALLVIKKDGTYQKVYQSAEFKNNPQFVVDETQGKVYIASGSKILVADL